MAASSGREKSPTDLSELDGISQFRHTAGVVRASIIVSTVVSSPPPRLYLTPLGVAEHRMRTPTVF